MLGQLQVVMVEVSGSDGEALVELAESWLSPRIGESLGDDDDGAVVLVDVRLEASGNGWHALWRSTAAVAWLRVALPLLYAATLGLAGYVAFAAHAPSTHLVSTLTLVVVLESASALVKGVLAALGDLTVRAVT